MEEDVVLEEQKYNQQQDKKIIKHIIFVAISNIITVLTGVLVGFVIPKIMGQTDYGYYKTFTLYIGYVGVFHFGFCDGIYLYFAGKKYESLEKEKFRAYSRFLLIFQVIIISIITLIAMFYVKSEYGFIFLFVGLYLLSNNVITYFQMISQITYRFKELSFINSLRSAITCVAVLSLFLVFKLNNDALIGYRIYVIIFTIISYVLALFYIIAYRDILFGKSKGFKEEKKNILLFFKLGFPLLLSNLVSLLILNIDRQFVSILYTTEEYAVYAFAYNLLSLVMTAISAVATVLYPSLKTKTEEELTKMYTNLNATMLVVVALGMISYFFLCPFVEWILPKYKESLPIFMIVFPGMLFSTSVSVVMSNYYKSFGKVVRFFVQSLIILGISIAANFIAYSIFKTTAAISIASIITLAIYYILSETYLIKRMKVKFLKNMIFAALTATAFYLAAYFIENMIISGLVYSGAILILIAIFQRNAVIHVIKTRFLKKD